MVIFTQNFLLCVPHGFRDVSFFTSVFHLYIISAQEMFWMDWIPSMLLVLIYAQQSVPLLLHYRKCKWTLTAVLGCTQRVWQSKINWRHHVSGDMTQRCGDHEKSDSSVSTFTTVWGWASTVLWNVQGMLRDPEYRWPLKACIHFIHDQLLHM